MRLQYCQLLGSIHYTRVDHKPRCAKAQDCFPVLAFENATLWRQLLKRLLALDCDSCEGFSTSGNAVFTSQEHAARTEVAYNLLNGMHRLAMGTIFFMVLQHFSSFAEHGLHAYTLPPPRWAYVDSQKTGSRLVGRRRRLQKPSVGARWQDKRQILHSNSSLLK